MASHMDNLDRTLGECSRGRMSYTLGVYSMGREWKRGSKVVACNMLAMSGRSIRDLRRLG